MEFEYIGKSLLLINEEKTLVVGDLHFGWDRSLRESGKFVPADLYKATLDDFEKIFEKIERVDRVIILGDLKHEFGRIFWEEREDIFKLFDYLRERCNEIVIVKGNHDKILEPLAEKKGLKVVDYFSLGSVFLAHGDRDFEKIWEDEIKTLIIGHGHPAIFLRDDVKEEKYKCFLEGKYKGKQIIVLPSFFPFVEGSDARDFDLGLAWDMKLERFNVKIVSENLEVLDFGKLKDLK